MAKLHPNKEINAAVEFAVAQGWRTRWLQGTLTGSCGVLWKLARVAKSPSGPLPKIPSDTRKRFTGRSVNAPIPTRKHHDI